MKTKKYILVGALIIAFAANTAPQPVLAEAAAVTCLSQATSSAGLDLSIEDGIELCHGATVALAPVRCFVQAFWEEGLDYELSLQLCNQAREAQAPISCYFEALNFDGAALSSDEAVNLCATNHW